MSLLDASQKGRLPGLEALRDALAQQIDACESARDLAALSRQMTEVLEQIEELKAPMLEKPDTPKDELRKRREARAKRVG